jgi:hypothetical protein
VIGRVTRQIACPGISKIALNQWANDEEQTL